MKEQLKLDKSNQLYKEGFGLVPGGVLGVRRPYNFIPGEYPIFMDSAEGGKVIDVDGNQYLDMIAGYGPIIIGHREREIDGAVIQQIRNKGFCMTLTQPFQNELVEELGQLIPSCEKAAIVKTGSDGTTLAVRIARGYSNRAKILRCGYHGWHDWCVEEKGGIPAKVYEDVVEFEYNNLDQFEDLMKRHGDTVAGIIMTPIWTPLGSPVQMPEPGFLEGVRSVADKYNSVLIFDEIRSGFRVNIGGAQQEYGVTPDLSIIGKAMANGYAISAVVGKKRIMNMLAHKVFVSSTFFPNSLEQVAALKTIEMIQRDQVLEVIREKGESFCKKVINIIHASGIPCTFSGAPWMPFITFDQESEQLDKKLRTEFYTHLIRSGIFLTPFHHGYIMYRHTDKDLDYATEMIAEALQELKTIF